MISNNRREVPMRNSWPIVLCTLALVLGVPAKAAEELWWDYLDNSWCMRMEDKQACLPETFKLERIAGPNLRFANRAAQYRSLFLTFETHSPDKAPSQVIIKQAFRLVKEDATKGLRVSEYQIDDSKKPNIRLFLIVIGIDRTHEIVLHGADSEELIRIADVFVTQWKDSS